MGATFWAFLVSIYRGACDRDAWPSRRVRRAAPAAAGGSRRNGPARCLGGAHARTGGRNCRTCGETNSPLPARKAERKDTSKMERYIVRNFLHFLQKHAILPASKERLRGGRRGGRGKSVPAAAGREPAAGQTKQFIYQHYQHVQQQLSIPGQTAARKTDGREPFPLSPFAARRGPDGPGPIPAPARTPAAEGGDAYDCAKIKKSL